MTNKQKILLIVPLTIITFTLAWPHIATGFGTLNESIISVEFLAVYGLYAIYVSLVVFLLAKKITNKRVMYAVMGFGLIVASLAILLILMLQQLGNVLSSLKQINDHSRRVRFSR